MYKSILLASDGSDYSFRAAKEALKFAGEESVITVLSVLETEAVKYDFLQDEPGEKDIKEKHIKVLQPITELYDSNNVNYQLRLESGNPIRKVVAIANEGTYDVVVIGSRGLNAFQEMMLGSVSHQVTKKSKIPVVIVK